MDPNTLWRNTGENAWNLGLARRRGGGRGRRDLWVQLAHHRDSVQLANAEADPDAALA